MDRRAPPRVSRRWFLRAGLGWLACLPLARLASCAPEPVPASPTAPAPSPMPLRTPTPAPALHEARHYQSLPDGRVACCPACGTLLIERIHFAVLEVSLDGGRCPTCGRAIPGLWPS
jgi:hypothetical protein